MKGLGKKFGEIALISALSFGFVNAKDQTNEDLSSIIDNKPKSTIDGKYDLSLSSYVAGINVDTSGYIENLLNKEKSSDTNIATATATPTPQPTATATPTPQPTATATPIPIPPSCDETTLPFSYQNEGMIIYNNPTKEGQEYVPGFSLVGCSYDCKDGKVLNIGFSGNADDSCKEMTNPTDINGTKDTNSEFIPTSYFEGTPIWGKNQDYEENLNDVNTTSGTEGNTGDTNDGPPGE